MKFYSFLLLLLWTVSPLFSQEKTGYQQPPQEILELVDAPLAPRVIIDDAGVNVVLLYRDPYKSIAELSEPKVYQAFIAKPKEVKDFPK